MIPAVRPMAEFLALNSRLFLNAFQGVSEEAARHRPGGDINSMIFLACHMLDARYFMARLIGITDQCPFQDLFDRAEGIEDMTEYPSLDALQQDWIRISTVLDLRFGDLSIEDLEAKSPQEFPVSDPSIQGGITFLLQHEAYHVGQLGLLRRLAGLPGLSYH